MKVLHRATTATLAVAAILLAVPPLAAQVPRNDAERQAFFDGIHAPNWIGTDILHTSIKSQRGGTCWAFSTISFLESEVLRTNDAVREALAAKKQELDLSEYYVVYWNWVEKTREYISRQGKGFHDRGPGVPLGDGGLSHDVIRIVREYGIVPESAYTVPENSGAMTREILAVLQDHRDRGDWDVDKAISRVRKVLDRHLAPPPTSITVDGKRMTPIQYATDYLRLELDNYWEITSYTSFPFYTRGEVDIPDNWWDYDGYYNIPLDAFLRTLNHALDSGYSVAIDTDWADMGAAWNQAGIAVIHPGRSSGLLISQASRQADLEEGRTEDDHLVHAVDHRVIDGHDWYLIKNSHGTGSGRRGYVWMRGDWVALRVIGIMLHKDALEPQLLARFNN